MLVLYSNADAGNSTRVDEIDRAPERAVRRSTRRPRRRIGSDVATDKPDYLPGDTVLFSGAGWAPNDTVTITVHEDPQWSNPDRTVTGVADGMETSRVTLRGGSARLRRDVHGDGGGESVGVRRADHVHGRQGRDASADTPPSLSQPRASGRQCYGTSLPFSSTRRLEQCTVR